MNYETKDSGQGREVFGSGAQRDGRAGKGRFDLVSPLALERLAKLYERGAVKYEARNWEKGMTFSRVLDSLERHANQYKAGDRSEDHLAAVAWNAFVLMHYEEMIALGKLPAILDDLPRYVGDLEEEVDSVLEPDATEVEPAGPDLFVERAKEFLLHSEGQTLCAGAAYDHVAKTFGASFPEFVRATNAIGADKVGRCPACGSDVIYIPVQGE